MEACVTETRPSGLCGSRTWQLNCRLYSPRVCTGDTLCPAVVTDHELIELGIQGRLVTLGRLGVAGLGMVLAADGFEKAHGWKGGWEAVVYVERDS